jgi:hypothetical protein
MEWSSPFPLPFWSRYPLELLEVTFGQEPWTRFRIGLFPLM